jgi:hypothetical protein
MQAGTAISNCSKDVRIHHSDLTPLEKCHGKNTIVTAKPSGTLLTA